MTVLAVPGSCGHQDDRGAGLIGTIGGVTVFLTLLTFSVQLLFNLYATSVVTSVAYDSAALVATSPTESDSFEVTHSIISTAEAQGRSLLGRYGERADFAWDIDDERVRLTLRVEHPKIAFENVMGAFGLNQVERSVEVHIERPK